MEKTITGLLGAVATLGALERGPGRTNAAIRMIH